LGGDEFYEVCLVGELGVPASASRAWRALPLDPSLYTDWPEAFARELASDEVVSIGTWIDDCKRDERAGERTFLEVIEQGHQLQLAALLDTEDYERFRLQLATMFRLSDRVGGRASLLIVAAPGQPARFGYRVEARNGHSTMRTLDNTSITSAQGEPAVRRILARKAA
jgi:hypothetical protein